MVIGTGELLAGLGIFFLCGAIILWIINTNRRIEELHQLDKSYNYIEEIALHKIAENIGLNIPEFEVKRRFFDNKSFREALEEKMVKDLIEKEINKKK